MSVRQRLEEGGEHVKPFLEHLEELRSTILQSACALAIGVLVCFPAAPYIFDLLKAPLLDLEVDPDRFLRSLQVAGAFSVALRTALWSGLLISTPFILYFVARFVFPGLKEREKQVILRTAGFAVGLFALGVLLGYAITLPVALGVMLKLHAWMGIQAEWTVTSYVAFAIQLMLGFGLAFDLPLVVVILGRMGIVSSGQLREKRRHVIIFLLVLAMVLTPPDVITQLLMAAPLAILYEVCILLVWATEKKSADDTEDGE